MRHVDLETPLSALGPITGRRAEILLRHGLQTLGDLLWRLPFRHEDRSRVTTVGEIRPGDTATLLLEVASVRRLATHRRGFTVLEAQLRDASGSLKVVFFNQGYLQSSFTAGARFAVFGTLEAAGLFPEMRNPEVERCGDTLIHMGRVVPIYERLGTLGPRAYRAMMSSVFNELPLGCIGDVLPAELRREEGLWPRDRAFRESHFPSPGDHETKLGEARRALAFEELFAQQLGLAARRSVVVAAKSAPVLEVDEELRQRMRSVLPFTLTVAQKRVMREIVADLKRETPMQRLLQGDVGCGKTAVAALAMAIAAGNGHQAAMMAPTEILAEQHAHVLQQMLEPAGFRTALLTAGITPARRREVLAGLATGDIAIVVGTHSLIQDDVRLCSLALAVIDEQHRFGVAQRERLRGKGVGPHVLVMTATPIPRTLALTAYGDLDLSVIDELPPGRQAIKTVIKVASSEARAYGYVRRELERGRQAYVVCPVVDESESDELKSAEDWAREVGRRYFAGFAIGFVHGRLIAAERRRIMAAFVVGDLRVLVGTTVIEVGVDVANASVMVIEHAERFGLSQLHQLRGRIGRGSHASTCFLMIRSRVSALARRRLEVVRGSSDGFAIAEADLSLRGPGELVGTRQWGVPAFRVASLLRDHALLSRAHAQAVRWASDREWMGSGPARRLLESFASRHAGVGPS